jgi:hypothetical protein
MELRAGRPRRAAVEMPQGSRGRLALHEGTLPGARVILRALGGPGRVSPQCRVEA